MYMFVILKCLYQAWRVYCCVYVCYIEVPVPSMESVLLCICYEVPVPSMESVLLCIYLLY